MSAPGSFEFQSKKRPMSWPWSQSRSPVRKPWMPPDPDQEVKFISTTEARFCIDEDHVQLW